MTMIVNRWYFPIFAVGSMTLFYLNDNASISPVSSILIMSVAFMALALTERLDKLIKHNDSIADSAKKIEVATLLKEFTGS